MQGAGAALSAEGDRLAQATLRIQNRRNTVDRIKRKDALSQELFTLFNKTNTEQDVTDPEDPVGDSMGVAGVMDDIYWAGGPSYPIQFTVRLSTANKNIARVLTHTELASTEVLFRYNAYDYDAGQGRYYKAFHTNSVTLAGYIESSGGDLQIFIDTDQASDVMSPANFAFTLSVMPANVAQVLHRAVSVGSLWTSPWGVAAGNIFTRPPADIRV